MICRGNPLWLPYFPNSIERLKIPSNVGWVRRSRNPTQSPTILEYPIMLHRHQHAQNPYQSLLYGTRVVQPCGYVLWKGQVYTSPELIPLTGQLVKITEMENGLHLLIADINERIICNATHVSQAYTTNSVEHLPPEVIPTVRYKGIAYIRGNFIIELTNNLIPIHPEITKIFSDKLVFGCTYTTTKILVDGARITYAHWVQEE